MSNVSIWRKSMFIGAMSFLLTACQLTDEVSGNANNIKPNNDIFLVGGFTKAQDKSVSLLSYQAATKQLVNEKNVAQAINPSYLVWRESEGVLYTVATADNHKQAAVNVFTWDKTQRQFNLLQHLPISGNGACHLSFNESTQQLAVANYSSGDAYLFQVDSASHKLTQQGYFKNKGSSITPRQRSSHLHFADWDNTKQFLYITDLGTDEILVFNTKKPSFTPVHRVKLTPGDGPRHLAFHANIPVVYSLNELSNSITRYTIKPKGELALQDTVTLLNTPITNQTSSAIRISNDGRFLYAAVRGDNMLYVYAVSAEGDLSFVQKISTQGEHPRDFNFSPQQDYILVANQRSNRVNLFWRDNKTGKLTASDIAADALQPAYIGNF